MNSNESVIDLIVRLASTGPIRVSCECGSRAWVSPNSARWFVENFVDAHLLHGRLRIEGCEDITELRSSPVVSGA